MRSTEIAPLFRKPPKDLGLRQGVVQAWDAGTGRNTITLGGVPLDDLPMLNIADAPNIRPGDVVGVLRYRSTYFIVGRIVVPGSESFATAAVEFEHVEGFGQGFGLNSTFKVITSTDLQAPAWANRAAFTVWGNVSLYNTASDYRNVELFAGGGNRGDLRYSTSSRADINQNRQGSITAITQDVISDPDDMRFTVEAATGSLSLPSHNFNSVSVDALVIFTRSR